MKIAVVAWRFPISSETFVLRQVLGLLDNGVDVTVIALDDGGDWSGVSQADRARLEHRVRVVADGKSRAGSLRIELLKMALKAPLDRRSRQALRAYWAVYRDRQQHYLSYLLRSGPVHFGTYDAILAHFGPVGVIALYLRMAGRIGGPIATIFHAYELTVDTVVKANLSGYRRLFASAELLLPISRKWAEKLKGWGAPENKLRVVRMGVNLPDQLAPRPDTLNTPLKILSVGRFVEKKGHVYAVEGAMASRVPVDMDVIGFGDLEDKLRSYPARAGHNSLNIVGKLPHAEVLKRLDTADVFLLTSVTARSGDMEGVPVSLMEAMARGCAVIATDHSGTSELVTDGVSGLLVPERSSEAITAAIERLASGEIDIKQMRANAREIVAREFNNDILDSEIVEILAELGR